MTLDPAQLPDDIDALKVMVIAEAAAPVVAETRILDAQAEIANLMLTIVRQQAMNKPVLYLA